MLIVSGLRLRIGDTQILNGIDLQIQPGEKVGIVGPNGSGKTTLFNCLSGFIRPNEGKILFKGNDITRVSPHRRALLGIGRVFQNFGVFKEMTVLENIVTAIEGRERHLVFPFSRRNRNNQKRALGFLEEVGLAARAREKARALSGGQMRLLEIIRAVAFEAEVFLLDEPTAGVSPKMKIEVERLLRKLREMSRTVLIIEHDMNFIQQLCDRIVVLDVGKVVLDGAPDAVRSNPLLQEIYFGVSNNHPQNATN